jgi:hypothetical protein
MSSSLYKNFNKTRPYISAKPEVIRKPNYFNGGHGSELTAKRCSAYVVDICLLAG